MSGNVWEMPLCEHRFLVYRSRISRKEDPEFLRSVSWWMSGVRRIKDYGLVWWFDLQYELRIVKLKFTLFLFEDVILRIATVKNGGEPGYHIIFRGQGTKFFSKLGHAYNEGCFFSKWKWKISESISEISTRNHV